MTRPTPPPVFVVDTTWEQLGATAVQAEIIRQYDYDVVCAPRPMLATGTLPNQPHHWIDGFTWEGPFVTGMHYAAGHRRWVMQGLSSGTLGDHWDAYDGHPLLRVTSAELPLVVVAHLASNQHMTPTECLGAWRAYTSEMNFPPITVARQVGLMCWSPDERR